MGRFRFMGIFVMMGVFALATVGIGFLFAATADTTGIVSLLPLFAVFALLIAGTVVLARKALK